MYIRQTGMIPELIDVINIPNRMAYFKYVWGYILSGPIEIEPRNKIISMSTSILASSIRCSDMKYAPTHIYQKFGWTLRLRDYGMLELNHTR
jgi:hypothetical protein